MKKLLLFAVLFSLAGCQFFPAVAPIVSGVIMWKDGEARKYYSNEPAVLCRTVTKEESRRDGFYIVAGERNRFKIKIDSAEPGISRVSIRVNFMGDKQFAELIYQHIDRNVDTVEFENGRPTKVKQD